MKRAIFFVALLMIGAYAGVAMAATTDTVAVSANVTEGTSSVDITQTTVNFGNISVTPTNRRNNAGPMTVSYFAAMSPWSIRVFTNNSPGNGAEPEKAGLKGVDTTTYLPLKVWCANYGPGSTMPDPEGDTVWAANWLRVPEKDEHTTDPVTWRRLCYSGAELNPVGFDSHLAVDISGVKVQSYSTTLTVEIIHQ